MPQMLICHGIWASFGGCVKRVLKSGGVNFCKNRGTWRAPLPKGNGFPTPDVFYSGQMGLGQSTCMVARRMQAVRSCSLQEAD